MTIKRIHGIPVIFNDGKPTIHAQSVKEGDITHVEAQLFLTDNNVLKLKITPLGGFGKGFANNLSIFVYLGPYDYVNGIHKIDTVTDKMRKSKSRLDNTTWYEYYKAYFDKVRNINKIKNTKTRKWTNAQYQYNMAMFINRRKQMLHYAAGGIILDNDNNIVVVLGIGELLFHFKMNNNSVDIQNNRFDIKDTDHKPMLRKTVRI